MLYIGLFILFAVSFICGMMWLRVGLFNLSGKKTESLLAKMTNSPLKGMLAGIIMTMILQSSSAVSVIAVGLVAARVLTFPQTMGIILGTNIGTTLTLELFTIDLSYAILPLLITGAILQFFRHLTARSCGFVLLGIGIIFTSMHGFEWLAQPLANVHYVQTLLLNMEENILIAFLIGTILTAIIQSSTVMTGISMSFLTTGTFPLETGLAIMIGANIGTCATALLASVGGGNEARLTAFAHVWLNVGGALLFLPFLSYLAKFSMHLAQAPDLQLAHASIIYNVACSLMVLPFVKQFSKAVITVHGSQHPPT